MSMREFPTSGYVVPVSDLVKLLTPMEQERIGRLIEDGDRDGIEHYLNDNLPGDFPGLEVYCPADEDTVDEPMERGIWYAVFDESDLYEKKLSARGEALNKAGVKVVAAHWSVWG
jgi:hypothetical protein